MNSVPPSSEAGRERGKASMTAWGVAIQASVLQGLTAIMALGGRTMTARFAGLRSSIEIELMQGKGVNYDVRNG